MATKLEKLGIKDTREFGDKYRSLINKLNKGNGNGEYVGYQLSTNRDQLTIIGKKGTLLVNIVDYDNFPSPKSFTPVLASAVHYKEGGKTGKIKITKISDIPNLEEKVNAGKVTYRGLGMGKLMDDFIELAGEGGTRIKVDGKEYFITDTDFRKLEWDDVNQKWLNKIRFAAPKRKSYGEGGGIDGFNYSIGGL
jgi:hypothetical protein